jgi:hypothetical protein
MVSSLARSATLRAAASTLVIDAATAEVVAALRARNVPSVLLRGPAIARRLFRAGEVRPYLDLDLLVSPDRQRDAAEVLAGLGFARIATDDDLAGQRPLHASEWRRASDRVSVDLHRTVSGARAPEAEVWLALEQNADEARIGGETVAVPNPAALALVLALHAAHNGPRGSKTLADLARGLQGFEGATWAAAATLARRLDALPAFSAGLRLLPEGAALAARFAPDEPLPVDVALRAAGAPPLALGFEWLAGRPGTRTKLRLALRVLAPSRGALRSWRVLARRGRIGLAAAYLSHPFWLARHALPSLLALRRARKAAS